MIRRALARAILAVVVPIGVGEQLAPYESWRRQWCEGAGVALVGLVVIWAMRELAPPEAAGDV